MRVPPAPAPFNQIRQILEEDVQTSTSGRGQNDGKRNMAKLDFKIMKALIKHKKQMNRKPLWGAEVMLYLQGNCLNDTNLTHNGQFFILNEFCKEFLPQVCLWILSPKRQRNHECIYRSRVRTRKYTAARAAALQAPLSLSTLVTGTEDSTWVQPV